MMMYSSSTYLISAIFLLYEYITQVHGSSLNIDLDKNVSKNIAAPTLSHLERFIHEKAHKVGIEEGGNRRRNIKSSSLALSTKEPKSALIIEALIIVDDSHGNSHHHIHKSVKSKSTKRPTFSSTSTKRPKTLKIKSSKAPALSSKAPKSNKQKSSKAPKATKSDIPIPKGAPPPLPVPWPQGMNDSKSAAAAFSYVPIGIFYTAVSLVIATVDPYKCSS
uniref:Transmembrane protein n=1 Tax=Chaetoceros debilis TaxID=122233 RepID=A0A6S8SK46_9STRA